MNDEFELQDDYQVEEPPATIGQLQDLVEELIVTVEQARSMPLSPNAIVDRHAFVDRLRNLRELLPEELRTARWMVREREAFIAQTNEQAEELMRRTKSKAAELVSDSHVMAEAVEEANVLVRNAETEARAVRLQAEDVAERAYEQMEALLLALLEKVQAQRTEFHLARPEPPPVPISE
jgi:hypothetical protein